MGQLQRGVREGAEDFRFAMGNDAVSDFNSTGEKVAMKILAFAA